MEKKAPLYTNVVVCEIRLRIFRQEQKIYLEDTKKKIPGPCCHPLVWMVDRKMTKSVAPPTLHARVQFLSYSHICTTGVGTNPTNLIYRTRIRHFPFHD